MIILWYYQHHFFVFANFQMYDSTNDKETEQTVDQIGMHFPIVFSISLVYSDRFWTGTGNLGCGKTRILWVIIIITIVEIHFCLYYFITRAYDNINFVCNFVVVPMVRDNFWWEKIVQILYIFFNWDYTRRNMKDSHTCNYWMNHYVIEWM